MRRLALSLGLILALSAATTGALEIERGDVRLILHPESSRFSLFGRHDGQWVPLLYGQDPRTTSLDVRVDNRVLRLGDSGDFSQTIVTTDNGAGFLWQSPTLEVAQHFEFVRGADSRMENGVQITVTVRSRAERPVEAAVRLLLDTYLGEDGNVHFVTSSGDRVGSERRLTGSAASEYILSIAAPDDPFGLQIALHGSGVTPAELYLANWRRLSDSTWEFQANETRNFNRLPYSINDSAALLLFPSRVLQTNDAYAVVARIGLIAPSGYLDPETSADTIPERDVQAMLLERLRRILARVNELLDADEADAAEIESLQTELLLLNELIRGL